MLFVPITWRANFCARKFISFDAFEHEKIPNDVEVSASRAAGEAGGGAVERLVPGRGAQHAVVAHERGGSLVLPPFCGLARRESRSLRSGVVDG